MWFSEGWRLLKDASLTLFAPLTRIHIDKRVDTDKQILFCQPRCILSGKKWRMTPKPIFTHWGKSPIFVLKKWFWWKLAKIVIWIQILDPNSLLSLVPMWIIARFARSPIKQNRKFLTSKLEQEEEGFDAFLFIYHCVKCKNSRSSEIELVVVWLEPMKESLQPTRQVVTTREVYFLRGNESRGSWRIVLKNEHFQWQRICFLFIFKLDHHAELIFHWWCRSNGFVKF